MRNSHGILMYRGLRCVPCDRQSTNHCTDKVNGLFTQQWYLGGPGAPYFSWLFFSGKGGRGGGRLNRNVKGAKGRGSICSCPPSCGPENESPAGHSYCLWARMASQHNPPSPRPANRPIRQAFDCDKSLGRHVGTTAVRNARGRGRAEWQEPH